MKSMKRLIIVAAVLLVALIAWCSCTYTVNSDEYAVVKQFGKVVSIQDTTGLKFKAPFVQSVDKLPKKQLISIIIYSVVLTVVLWGVFTQLLNCVLP